MLIQALCEYADKQTASVEDGYCIQQVHYRVLLSPDGEITDIVDVRKKQILKDKKGKEKEVFVPLEIKLPFREKSTSIKCYCGEHRPSYIFGLSETDKKLSAESDKDKARKSHTAFVKHELEFYDGLDTKMCIAYKNFVEKWIPENEVENPVFNNVDKFSNSYFCFGLEGNEANLEEDKQFIAKYESLMSQTEEIVGKDEDLSQCAVLGKKLPIARIHDNIKKFPGGNSMGCVLVGMKEDAFTSYGKTQSYNSNISQKAMKKYTSALNSLLSDRRHHLTIDDMTLIYFAMKSDDSAECDEFNAMMGMPGVSAEEVENIMDSGINKAACAVSSDMNVISEIEKQNDVTFYMAGLTPNASRLSQKFILREKFSMIIANAEKHQKDMTINKKRVRPIYFSDIRKELISPKSKSESAKVPSPLMSGIILAALNGTPYPKMLLDTVVRRIKIDSDEEKNSYIKLNEIRAGIIKACINRSLKREEIKMSLDKNNLKPAYLCGRLFAVYEMIQLDASSSKLNKTIKDSYFSSACSRPNVIMPKLSKLSINHMRNLEKDEKTKGYAIRNQKVLDEIMDGFDGRFPETLTLEEQGEFIIGYYQQKNDFFVSNKTSNGKDE